MHVVMNMIVFSLNPEKILAQIHVFVFEKKKTTWICAKFFQDLGENTCSLQPAMKSTALGL